MTKSGVSSETENFCGSSDKCVVPVGWTFFTSPKQSYFILHADVIEDARDDEIILAEGNDFFISSVCQIALRKTIRGRCFSLLFLTMKPDLSGGSCRRKSFFINLQSENHIY